MTTEPQAPLSSRQRKYLRSQAHALDPVVMIGKQGVTEALVKATRDALDAHELIKVRFIDFKDQKKQLAPELAETTGSELAGLIGHVAILYRQHPDEEKRHIRLPKDD